MVLTVLILLFEAAIFIICGEKYTYIGIHDNLDIHIADYRVLKLTGTFFDYNAELPILGGISRSFLLSGFSLYAFLHMVFPTFVAYIIGYFLKILIAITGAVLLGKNILKERYSDNAWIIVM
ncbi:DUF6044 family protein [Butyrivibrio sp. INlla21]|uniref:DUF6044 family protein n=1 Tax=Butyrivibrio sp. INlla21 TaxID=1520811 RepID=UPI002E8E327A|nr:DUF6044 family protein [Butyrivibrio sp. INlla21]